MRHFLGGLYLLSAGVAVAGPDLRFGFSANDGEPLVFLSGDKIEAGIQYDFAAALAQELHRKPQYVVLPRKRVDIFFASGAVDLVCYSNPFWLAAGLGWSEAWLKNKDVIISKVKADNLSIKDLDGNKVGMIIGYKYPFLDGLQNIIRVDSLNQGALLKRFQNSDYHYAVTNFISFQYFYSRQPAAITPGYHVVGEADISCGVAPKSKTLLPEINVAIRHLKASGAVHALLLKYLPETEARQIEIP